MTAIDQTVDTLNGLLRGELSATETYDQALEKVDEGTRAVLRRIRVEHYQAVRALQEQIRHLGGQPTTSSGPWGTFAQLVEGTATLLGTAPTLRALREGERQGLSDSQKALAGEHLAPEPKELVRNILIPQTQGHLDTLDHLLGL